ncbi:MAG: DUF4418 family protein [Anaerolineae bacterium]
MKAIGGILVVLALVLGIVPLFSDCHSQGSDITLANGATIPMKCHWTGRAELAVAGPLLFVGGLATVSRRKRVLRTGMAFGLILGTFALLLPTTLIGVCENPEMICNMVMKPTLIFAGLLAGGASLAGLVYLRGDAPDLLEQEEGR